MDYVLYALVFLRGILRVAFFWLAIAAAVIALVDWLVRTRRINPFNPVARFFRTVVDPLIRPIERRIVRAGGMPTSAPWWALVAVVVGGILLLTLLDFLTDQLYRLSLAFETGPRGLLRLLVSLTFDLLQIALLVRVISSWFRISEWNRWIRWAVVLTEPILRPLRQVIPPLGGMIDITPIIAWLLLGLLQGVVVGLL